MNSAPVSVQRGYSFGYSSAPSRAELWPGKWAILGPVSPTVLRVRGYRFYFFSREELRRHIHVQCPDGEAKFWLEPQIALAQNHGLDDRQIRIALALIEEHVDEIRTAWDRHFVG